MAPPSDPTADSGVRGGLGALVAWDALAPASRAEPLRGDAYFGGGALAPRAGGDVDRTCLAYELKRPALTADSTAYTSLKAIFALSDAQVDELCDSDEEEAVHESSRVDVVASCRDDQDAR